MPSHHPGSRPGFRARRWVFATTLAAWAFGAASSALPADWAILDTPTTHHLNRLSFVDDLHGWVAGDSATILVTADGGGSWTAQPCPLPYDVVDIEMLDLQRGWALVQQFPVPPTWEYGTTVIRTTNGGADWFVEETFADLLLHAMAFTDSVSGCIAGEQGRLWWTDDAGVTWTEAHVDSADAARWPIYDLTFHTPAYGMATGGYYDVTGIVWTTLDGGRNWTHQRVAGEPFFGTHFFDSLNVICVGGDIDYGSGMVRTTNGGADWEYTYLGIWGQASALAFRTATEAWAPLGFAGTYMKTIDAGDRWDAMFTPDSTAMRHVVFTDSTTGYMAGDEGTVLRWIDPAAVGAPVADAGATTRLLQAYPNPVRNEARLDFRVPRPGFVSLVVYDVRGREVATLVRGSLPGGTYSRTLDARTFPNGVYFCRLVTGKDTETRKVILAR